MTTATVPTDLRSTERGAFSRVVVGVDGSPEALEAARQASLLAGDAPLTLVASWNIEPPVVGAFTAAYMPDADVPQMHAEQALSAARAHLADAAPQTALQRGTAWRQLIEECERREATLVAVGSHGQGRAYGILNGSTTTELVHNAPCSVLVARAAGETFPHRIVVGVDGSPQSARAQAVARQLADRFGAQLWPVVAHGKGMDKTLAAQTVERDHEDLLDTPVQAILAAGADADLVVVGSRGLHGLRALGSVSERVAHRAHCSVLIVR
jgi:nucleotide-binding universal stress UspA family protein